MAENPKVVVTTKHRGVFYGTLIEKNGTDCVLADARVCIYWSKETRGFVGLAATGPADGSRVSPSAPRMEIVDVTAILHCSADAIDKWEQGKWS